FERWETNAEAEIGLAGLAGHFIEAMRTVQPHGPYRLGGYCFGGWVAFAMAQELRAQGESVELLALLDIWGPRHLRYGRLPCAARLTTTWARMRRLGITGAVRALWKRFHASTAAPTAHENTPWYRYPSGVYALRTFPGRLHLFRGETQPDWYMNSAGDDLS